MANSVEEEFILNDTHNIIVKYDVLGDGSGELSEVLFNITSAYNSTAKKKLWKIEYELTGFSASLEWFGDPNLKQIITLEENHHEHVCWEWFSGYSNSDVTGATGSIIINTIGFGDGDKGYIILYLKNKERMPGT